MPWIESHTGRRKLIRTPNDYYFGFWKARSDVIFGANGICQGCGKKEEPTTDLISNCYVGNVTGRRNTKRAQMPYLNLDLDFFDHPKTKRLVGLLGKGAEVLAIRLWCACGKYQAESGRLIGYSTQAIEATCAWWGRKGEMVDAMLEVGFIEKTDDGFQVHDWPDHAGHLAAFKERAVKAARKRWESIRKPRDDVDATSMPQALLKHTSSNANHRGYGSAKPGGEGWSGEGGSGGNQPRRKRRRCRKGCRWGSRRRTGGISGRRGSGSDRR